MSEEVSDKIARTAQAILLRNKKFTHTMAKRVTSCLLEALAAKASPAIDRKDVESIAAKLTINGNRSSIYTWLHQELFNRIVVHLRNSKAISCPFIINTASKKRRNLIIFFNEKALSDIPRVKHVIQYLLDFKDCSDTFVVSPEVDILCSYIASSIVFSQMTFPAAYKALLGIERSNISFDHSFINIPLKDEPVSYRHFLGFHTAARLNRAILYYSYQRHDASSHSNGERLLQPSFSVASFPTVFSEWLSGVTRSMPEGNNQTRLGLRSFTDTARCLAVLKSFTGDADTVNMPCFLHSIHSRSLSCYSYPDFFLSYILEGTSPGTYTPSSVLRHQIYEFRDREIELLNTKITSVRRRLLSEKTMTSKERLKEVERIPSIVAEYESVLSEHSYLNAKYYAEWFVSRYHAGTELKTLSDYASMVVSFLDTLAVMKKTVSEMSDKDLFESFKTLAAHYQSRAIKSRVKDYVEFVTSEYGTNLSASVWKMKGTQLQDIRSPKPFIGYDLIEKANKQVLRFLASRQVPLRNEPRIQEQMKSPALVHKARQMKHFYCLLFFFGLRRDEAYRCTVGSIRYDDGPILVIEEGKTANARRSIPLFLLLPDEYLADFLDFVQARKAADGPEAYLFVNERGERWDPKEFYELIQELFTSLGIPDYVLHANRSSFASWFLLRWVKVLHRDKLSGSEPFLKFELFKDEYDNRFRQLFWGSYSDGKDRGDFSHAIFALARILGHGGPVVTLEQYCHTADWIYLIFLRHYESKDLALSIKQVANLLQVHNSTLYRRLQANQSDKINPADVLCLQGERLGCNCSKFER